MDMQRPREAGGTDASAAPSEPIGYTPVSATDAAELTHDVRDWNFEFMQLSAGKFRASGAMLQLDGVSIARVSMERTLLQRGFAARGMFAVFIPGVGSGPIYAQGQLVEAGQCATLMEGAQLEAIIARRVPGCLLRIGPHCLSPAIGGVEPAVQSASREAPASRHPGRPGQMTSWVASTGS